MQEDWWKRIQRNATQAAIVAAILAPPVEAFRQAGTEQPLNWQSLLFVTALGWGGVATLYTVGRLGYYPIFVIRNMPALVIPFTALAIATGCTYLYFRNIALVLDEELKWGNIEPVIYSFTIDPILIAWLAGIGAPFLVRAYRKLRVLTFRTRVPHHLVTVSARYLGPELFRKQISRTKIEPTSDTSYSFRIEFLINEGVGSLALVFVVLEALDERERSRGVVWTSSRLRPIRPLALLSPGASSNLPLNLGHKIWRCVVRNGSELDALVWASQEEASRWFGTGAALRVTVYFEECGVTSHVFRI